MCGSGRTERGLGAWRRDPGMGIWDFLAGVEVAWPLLTCQSGVKDVGEGCPSLLVGCGGSWLMLWGEGKRLLSSWLELRVRSKYWTVRRQVPSDLRGHRKVLFKCIATTVSKFLY
jgi:hypothetical protein